MTDERTGCDCCDPTSDSPDPVIVRLERDVEELRAEVERLTTAWKAIDRANESLRERLAEAEAAARILLDELSQFTRVEWLLERWPWLKDEANT